MGRVVFVQGVQAQTYGTTIRCLTASIFDHQGNHKQGSTYHTSLGGRARKALFHPPPLHHRPSLPYTPMYPPSYTSIYPHIQPLGKNVSNNTGLCSLVLESRHAAQTILPLSFVTEVRRRSQTAKDEGRVRKGWREQEGK